MRAPGFFLTKCDFGPRILWELGRVVFSSQQLWVQRSKCCSFPEIGLTLNPKPETISFYINLNPIQFYPICVLSGFCWSCRHFGAPRLKNSRFFAGFLLFKICWPCRHFRVRTVENSRFFCFFNLQSEPSRHFGCADLQKLEVFCVFFRPSILVCGECCIFLWKT